MDVARAPMGYRDVRSGGTPGSGLRGGGIREGSPTLSGPYAGASLFGSFLRGWPSTD